MRRTSLHLVLAACVAMTAVLPACSGDKNKQQQSSTRTATDTTIQTAGDLGDSLDLSRLPSLVKQAKDGQELEEILNTSGVNNIDLNQDGKIDYLNVEEIRENGAQGFILFTNENNERVDVARIDITKTQSTADVAVSGNPQYYGNQQVVYRDSFPLGQILLAAWLFDLARPRYYHPPYYYGSYPKYYRSYRPVLSRSLYRSKVSSGSFSVKGKTLSASASRRAPGTSSSFSTGSSKRTMTGGSSFSTTTNKRPAGSLSNSSGFGSSSRRTTGTGSSTSTGSTRFGSDSSGLRSTTSNGAFGSSSNRSKPSFSFGGSSNRSSSGSSFSGRSSSSSSRRSSFGGSSSRRRR